MPRTLPARPRPSHTSLRTSSVRPPTRSRPHVPPPRKERARAQGDSSAGGSAAPGGDPRARTRRPAVAEPHLLVGVPLLGARRGARTAQQAHQCVREHSHGVASGGEKSTLTVYEKTS